MIRLNNLKITRPQYDEMVERMAKAIHCPDMVPGTWEWSEEDQGAKSPCQDMARAALKAIGITRSKTKS